MDPRGIMITTVEKTNLSGTVKAKASKSCAHRLLICAGLAKGVSKIKGVAFNEDILATIDCLQALGVNCQIEGDTVTVTGADLTPSQTLCCRESGSTLRFLIPPALLCATDITFTGAESLFSRKISRVTVYLTGRHLL